MRLGREQPSELRRLQDDFRELKAEARAQGEQLEEARAQEAAARAAAAQARAELDAQRQHVQRHLTQARPSTPAKLPKPQGGLALRSVINYNVTNAGEHLNSAGHNQTDDSERFTLNTLCCKR